MWVSHPMTGPNQPARHTAQVASHDLPEDKTASRSHPEPSSGSWRSLPNLKWIGCGMLLTLGFVLFEIFFDNRPPIPIILTFLPGLPVAFAFLLFNNPREQKSGLHIVISTPFISVLWPLFLLILVAVRPWNSKAWKQRTIGNPPMGT